MAMNGNIDFSLLEYTPPSGDSVDFEMSLMTESRLLFGFGVRGKVGDLGKPDPLGAYGIYQQRLTKRGKRPIRMKFYTPTNPQTVAQQANRQKFADAMEAWGNLTTGQKQEYTIRAKRRNMFGWGLFIREYYQNN